MGLVFGWLGWFRGFSGDTCDEDGSLGCPFFPILGGGDPLTVSWVISVDDIFEPGKVSTGFDVAVTFGVLLLGSPPNDISAFGHEAGPVGASRAACPIQEIHLRSQR